jgi:hypothetical protein
MNKWETISEEDAKGLVCRFKIDGGWIYYVDIMTGNHHQSTFFVPEPEKCSYHNEYLVKCCHTCHRAKSFNFNKEKILDLNILDIGLTVRTSRCLRADKIKTIGDVIKYSKRDLLKFTNFGRKSLRELEEVLKKYNITLEEGIE